MSKYEGYKIGDTVRCITSIYVTYPRNSYATVRAVKEGTNGDTLIILDNHISPEGIGPYMAKNFQVVNRLPSWQRAKLHQANQELMENKNMAAYEKTNYIITTINDDYPTFSANLEPENEVAIPSKSEAFKYANDLVRKTSKKVIILQTVALLELAEPVPPIKTVEYH